MKFLFSWIVFTVGLTAFGDRELNDQPDWELAEWIQAVSEDIDHPLSSRPYKTHRMEAMETRKSLESPLLRKEFEVEGRIASATAHVVGLGYYEFYVNGSKMGDHVLNPAQSNFDSFCYYTTYDLTRWLRSGKNAMGIWLGNGFYGQNITWNGITYYGPPCARMILEIVFRNGERQTIVSDSSWKSSSSPIVFNNVYGGESYDARLEQPMWSRIRFDDGDWKPVDFIEGPSDDLRPQSIEPIRVTRYLDPKSIFLSSSGNWIVDFGENISGWIRLELKEKAGTEIRMTYAEHANPDGMSVNIDSTGAFATGMPQMDVYIAKGDGVEIETWEPRFTYHGFRYVEIEGVTGELRDVFAAFAHTDLDRAGNFKSSDDLLNQMVDVSLRTMKANMHSIPEDCPHREKCGWTGDTHLIAETGLYYFYYVEFMEKYMVDIESNLGRGAPQDLNDDGTPKYLVPTMIAPGKRTAGLATTDWGVALVLIPHYLEKFTGESSSVEKYLTEMEAWLRHQWKYFNDGLIENGLGDWCSPRWDRQTNPDDMSCHPDIQATLLYLHALDLVRSSAEKLGRSKLQQLCAQKFAELKPEFEEKVLVPGPVEDSWTYGSQTAMALALGFDLVPEDKKEGVILSLLHNINVVHKGHHDCGVFGGKHLYSVLCENGHEDLAYEILTKETFPSYAYFLSKGFTTWPERQKEVEYGQAYRDRSSSHPFHVGFLTFFHEWIAGIRQKDGSTGFTELEMKPGLIDKLDWVECHHDAPQGRIQSNWRVEDGVFHWDIELPEGTTAKVWLPVEGSGRDRVEWKLKEVESGVHKFRSQL